MSTINVAEPIFTHEAQRACRISPIRELERSVMSCLLWEDQFYEDGKGIAERIKDLVSRCDPMEVARVAIEAKRDMLLRHVPLLVARELVRRPSGRKCLSLCASHVFTRPDDITEFLALYWMDNKDEPLAKQVKKCVGDAFRQFSEYQLAKYNGGQKAVKLRDALRILRPKPESQEQAELWGRLVKGTLATPDTWEVELSKSKDKKASWERLLREGKIGGLAMLRNIRNMTLALVDKDLIREGIRKIVPGKLLPINFIAAARHNPQYEPEIEEKFFQCFVKEKISGGTVLLIDTSPSMDWPVSGKSELSRMDVACSLAMIGREMFSDLRVFAFSSTMKEVPARRGFGLKDSITSAVPRNGTLLGAALKALPACDRLIVITDEESQDKVPQMEGFMINVASYKNGVGYGKWVHIDGWSDRVLDFVLKYESSE